MALSTLSREESKAPPVAVNDDPSVHETASVPTQPRMKSDQKLQILSTFIVFMNTWGFLLMSGVFQAYYELYLISEQSSSNIAWISTTCAFIVLSAGLVTGPLYDRGFYKMLLLLGSLLQVFGLMMLSLSTEYYQLFLCQGVCVGLGAGIVFTPSVSAAAACLPNPATRAKAMGLMACGSCIGGIIYPIMFRALCFGVIAVSNQWSAASSIRQFSQIYPS
ncbi:hypothetical protein DL764_001574 [Monosporascus ibericus]|uniref:Major facilitator superfamily (MFS) profile domain-containing protein n=1 Tax=Monosporascus ibericus TaxID=155417 RepID=A0A4Q4TTY1_9PEZI|nr:hypothetical protein DL764_001574 [Monosporascus ibericus]